MDIEDIVDAITDIFNGCTDWISTVITIIETHKLLLFVVLIPFVSIGIALLKKLIHVKD